MNQYTIYCTPEQTKRAYKLGAPIETKNTDVVYNDGYCTLDYDEHSEFETIGKIPTAEQMMGWLREKGLFIENGVGGKKHLFQIDKLVNGDFRYLPTTFVKYDTYEQAILAAIDAALDYLEEGGNK